MYCTPQAPILGQNLYDPPYRLIKCGAPYDSIYLNDLALLDTAPYKLIIMLNTFHISDYQQQLIQKKLKNANKTVFWVYAPGIFNFNATDPVRIKEFTGMEISGFDGKELVVPKIELLNNTNTFVDEVINAGLRQIGPDSKSCFAFYVNDKSAKSLGRYPASDKTALAFKNMGNWNSVYSVTASLPSNFYRALARFAGVHIYNEKNDTLYISRSYLTINADGAGTRVISLPQSADVYDAITENVIKRNVKKFELTLKDKETKILRMETIK